MLSRRQALQTGAMAGAMFALPSTRAAYAFAQTPPIIPLFDTDLRGIGTIGVAKPDPTPAPVTGVLHYTLNIDQFQDDGVAPTVGQTTLRGYSPTRLLAGQAHRHLGGIIVAHKGQPIQITFRNNLPAGKHIIPNDLTLGGASEGNNRTSVHFHGGLTPWVSDGGPFAWWDPTGRHGVSFLNNQVRTLRSTRRSTTTRLTRARGSAGITTTPSASPASTPTPASPLPFSFATDSNRA